MGDIKRYVLVGTGVRAALYVDALAGRHSGDGVLLVLADTCPTRMRYYDRRIRDQFGHNGVLMFHASDFDRMIRQTQPDVVIVTSTDCTHHHYIIRSMELGCDVICEKPMTIDGEKLRAIFSAIDRTGRSLRVTFNLRYSPISTKVREIVAGGTIGRPTAVDFSWTLDTSHGADYFRRWHRHKDHSGGLLIHKASHHFDAINWWIDSYPQRVFAMGDLSFYGRQNAESRGESYSYERYTGSPDAQSDPFAFSLDANETLRALYLDAEEESGYIRDRNVFNDDITIEDTMAVTARYRNGVILNYSLLAYSPWEGVRVAITGTRGRVEMIEQRRGHILEHKNGDAQSPQHSIRIYPMFGSPYDVELPKMGPGHDEYDPLLMRDLFSPHPPADLYGRAASHIDGAASVLLGICANQSIATGQAVDCNSILNLPKKEVEPLELLPRAAG